MKQDQFNVSSDVDEIKWRKDHLEKDQGSYVERSITPKFSCPQDQVSISSIQAKIK